MTIHLAAYRSSADQAGAAASLNAVVDQAINTDTTFIRVAPAISNLIGEAFLTGAITAFTSALVQSPSLRQLANQAVSRRGLITDTSKELITQWHGASPRALVAGEGLEFVTNTDAAGAVELQGYVWLADGAVKPVQGNIFTTRATATVQSANGSWTAGALTFQERLPFGTYDVVGLSVLATDCAAARLIFPGLPFRPGVLISDDETGNSLWMWRFGNAGVMGTFDLNQPPQLEVTGGTAAAQVVYLDLIKRS